MKQAESSLIFGSRPSLARRRCRCINSCVSSCQYGVLSLTSIAATLYECSAFFAALLLLSVLELRGARRGPAPLVLRRAPLHAVKKWGWGGPCLGPPSYFCSIAYRQYSVLYLIPNQIQWLRNYNVHCIHLCGPMCKLL